MEIAPWNFQEGVDGETMEWPYHCTVYSLEKGQAMKHDVHLCACIYAKL